MNIPDILLDYGYWLTWRQDPLPEYPGVYVILVRIKDSIFYEVLYIGSTTNLKKRITNHEIIKKHISGVGVTGLRCHFREAKNYRELEIAMIEKHAPLANINHQLNGI